MEKKCWQCGKQLKGEPVPYYDYLCSECEDKPAELTEPIAKMIIESDDEDEYKPLAKRF
jgi:uncharacterized protein YlaI